jgi:hypothetical protein
MYLLSTNASLLPCWHQKCNQCVAFEAVQTRAVSPACLYTTLNEPCAAAVNCPVLCCAVNCPVLCCAVNCPVLCCAVLCCPVLCCPVLPTVLCCAQGINRLGLMFTQFSIAATTVSIVSTLVRLVHTSRC